MKATRRYTLYVSGAEVRYSSGSWTIVIGQFIYSPGVMWKFRFPSHKLSILWFLCSKFLSRERMTPGKKIRKQGNKLAKSLCSSLWADQVEVYLNLVPGNMTN